MPNQKLTIEKLKSLKKDETFNFKNKKFSLNSGLNEFHKTLPSNIRLSDVFKFEKSAQLHSGFDNPEIHNYKYEKDFRALPYSPELSFIFSEFGKIISEKLEKNMMGFCIKVTKYGMPIYSKSWNKGQTAKDANLDWTKNTRMHIASCSKFITAVALVKLLKEKNISYDAKIAEYLPAYWNLHQDITNVNKVGIRFRDLLTHKSGLSPCDSGENSYLVMKSLLSKCIRYHGYEKYENINFELMRILISIITGKISKTNFNEVIYKRSPFNDVADTLWNVLTIKYYQEYVYEHIFQPSGVKYAIFNSDLSKEKGYPTNKINVKALGYKHYGSTESGWDSGDLAFGAGAVGWRLTISELTKILNTVRHSDKIISKEMLNEMFQNNFGIYKGSSLKGDYFRHNGWWENGNEQVEQTAQFFFQDGIEIVAFGNSSLNYDVGKGKKGYSFEGEIFDAYQKSFAIDK